MMSLLKVIFLTAGASAFYIPGIAPQDFQEGETVNLKVNKLDSVITQLPYDYYSLPFCQPAKIEASKPAEVFIHGLMQYAIL